MSKETGGPAFPTNSTHNDEYYGGLGMTLRDYFAAKAMSIVPEMHAYNMKDNETWASYTARCAYIMADAMIAERNK